MFEIKVIFMNPSQICLTMVKWRNIESAQNKPEVEVSGELKGSAKRKVADSELKETAVSKLVVVVKGH